jgi:hypothetical protein
VRRLLAASACAAFVAALLAAGTLGAESPSDPPAAAWAGLRWAHLLEPATARERPASTSPVVTIVRPATPEGESNLVLALESREDAYGRDWVRVQLAILPNNSTGWVRREALGELHAVRTRLVVDRKRLRAVLWKNGLTVFAARVGVGEPRWPTPRGEFYVRQRLSGFGDPFYGPIAFGTSARSAVLTDWPGGGYIGIHGTNRPELLPGRVSHGCIRMRNEDIRRLARLMPLGTPLTVR